MCTKCEGRKNLGKSPDGDGRYRNKIATTTAALQSLELSRDEARRGDTDHENFDAVSLQIRNAKINEICRRHGTVLNQNGAINSSSSTKIFLVWLVLV